MYSFRSDRQPALKPQDVILTLKLAVHRHERFTYAELASDLLLSASEVHASAQRAELSRLIIRQEGRLEAVQVALREFAIHGLKYAFPPLQGQLTRGMPTAFAGPILSRQLELSGSVPLVWPDAQGEARGTSLLPLYPTVPAASKKDQRLYELLTLLDAIRAGAARERELAVHELMERLT